MRLNNRAKALLIDTSERALRSVCHIKATARNVYAAKRIFDAATPHLLSYKVQSDRVKLTWRFPNGSTIRIITDNGKNTTL